MAKITLDNLDKELKKLLAEYGNTVFEAVNDKGLAAAEKVLVDELKAASPEGETRELKKGWKGSGKKYKMVRFVGNTKTVDDGSGEQIPLTNILEYSTTHGNPFIKQTFESSEGNMTDALVTAVRQELT